MIRVLRNSSLLVAVMLMLLPELVFAIGFGDIRLYSNLHQPLNAQIDITGAEKFDPKKVNVRLASSRDFLRAGIDRPYFLTQLKFKLKREGVKTYVKVSSKHPIHDTSIELLVDMRWPDGHLVKAYTLLIEPTAIQPESRFSTSVDINQPEPQRPTTGTLTGGEAASTETSQPMNMGTMSGPSMTDPEDQNQNDQVVTPEEIKLEEKPAEETEASTEAVAKEAAAKETKPEVKPEVKTEPAPEKESAAPASSEAEKSIETKLEQKAPAVKSEEQTATPQKAETKVETKPEPSAKEAVATDQTQANEQADKEQPIPISERPLWKRFFKELVLTTLMIVISIFMTIKIILARRQWDNAGQFKTTTDALAQARSKETATAVNPMAEMAESVADEVESTPTAGVDLETLKRVQATGEVVEAPVVQDEPVVQEEPEAEPEQETTEVAPQPLPAVEEEPPVMFAKENIEQAPVEPVNELPEEVSESSFEPGTTMEASIKAEEGESNFEGSAAAMGTDLGGDDEYRTKLKLARQYLAAGDPETAREELQDIIENASGSVQKEARDLLNTIP